MISDLFPANTRGMAAGIFHWGVYFGFGASYLLGVYVTKCVSSAVLKKSNYFPNLLLIIFKA